MTLTYLTTFLLSWISFNTDYNTENFEAPIIELEDLELQEKACGGKCPVVAFFLSGEGIFIKKMDLTDPCNQSILLHEMIQSFQSKHKPEMENVFREKEAYEYQNQFLDIISEENGLYEKLNVRKCRSNQKSLF